MPVGSQHVVRAGERAHQHQQCRFRQMKVGDQCIHDLEVVAGVYKDTGLACKRLNTAMPGSRFKRTYNGRAHGDDSAALRFRGIDARRRTPRSR